MIKLLEEYGDPELRKAAGLYLPAGIHIGAICEMQSRLPQDTRLPDTQVWKGGDINGRLCAAALSGGRMYVSCEDCFDSSELVAFAQAVSGGFAVGYSAVDAPISVCRQLGSPDEITTGTVMRFGGGAGVYDDNIQSPPVSEAYALVCTVEGWTELDPRWSPWYIHLTRLVKYGIGFICGIYENGRLVSTGGVYAADDEYALIAGVATLPGYRGRGFARRIVAAICGRVIASGKTPVLMCAPELEGFYNSIGFVEHGGWASVGGMQC